MHAALQLTEILTTIFGLRSQDTKITNDALWRNVTAGSDRGTMFSRPFAELHWTRFTHHAERVRELDYDYGNKHQKSISPDAFVLLAEMRPQLDIILNLERLVWVVVEDDHFAFARLFTFSCTRTPRNCASSLLSNCPKLIDLDFGFNVSISMLEPALTNMFAALPDLEVVSFPAFGITSAVLHALAHHRHLKRLHACSSLGLHFFFWQSIDVGALPAGCFPNLQEFDLDSGFNVMHTVLSAPCIPRTLIRLYVSAFERECESLSALTAFLDLPPDMTAADTDIATDVLPRITLGVLRPALHMRTLHSFHIMHNRTFSSGSPSGTLHNLRLVPDSVFVPSTVSSDADLTLGGLQIFARLEHLEVYIDASRAIPTAPPTHAFAYLTTLDIGISPIARQDKGVVTRWLAKLAPCPDLRIIFSAELEHLLPRRNVWQCVDEIHTQFCIISEESDKKIGRLEEELRMLRLTQAGLNLPLVSLLY
ncbi:hypothetical protein DFH11DRAFT_1842757 [Phellopilus nigrolimitatus]|nr:hypothetical protein DFH11DRAFT_1842757 [Phellopilus nigrolimitatus]